MVLMSNNILAEIVTQSNPDFNGTYSFPCADCVNHTGGCQCNKGIFIAFEGANLSNCIYYERGRKCYHCGRIG